MSVGTVLTSIFFAACAWIVLWWCYRIIQATVYALTGRWAPRTLQRSTQQDSAGDPTL